MAQNEYAPGIGENLAVAASKKSGDPALVGAALVGVCQTDRDASGNAIVDIRPGKIWTLPVKGIDGGGNSAVAVGDKIYYVAGDTPNLSKKTSGVLFGKALQTVSSGATTTIQVQLLQV